MDALRPRERVLGPALRTQPDRRLVALARDGSEPAQEEIVRRYRAALVRYARSIVGPAAAEDVVQEALAKGVAALAAGDEELSLRPWLYAIVRNTGLNHLRDAGPATEQLDENYDGVEQPPQALERREGVRSLFGGLRRLPREQREAIVKRELEGRSHEEIAAELGVSRGAARQLIFRAREALRVGFGSLLPMPLLRWLAEGGGAGDAAVGVAAGAGGGALAAKAAVAVFAAGAAVTAGVAIDHGDRRGASEPPAAAEVAVRPAVALPGGVGAVAEPEAEPVAAFAGAEDGASGRGDRSGHGSGPSGTGHDGAREDEDGDDRGDGGDGPGPSAHSGPGRDGEESEDFELDDDDGGGHGKHSGSGGPGRSGGHGDRSGSSQSGHDGAESDDRSSDHSGSGSSTSGSGGSGRSSESESSGSSGGKGPSSSGSSGGDGTSGGDGHSEGDDGVDEASSAPLPSAEPAPAPVEETSSGSGSGGGDDFGDDSRDLSSGTVSQGSDDPD